MKSTSWVTLIALVAVVGLVVWSSLRIGGARCEVCITFRDRQMCRAVDGQTKEEARQAAVTNACAILASGVTDTIACQGTPPDRVTCTP